MPTQPQRLLDLAAQLLQREPWQDIEERSIFLVKVPGRQQPVTVTIFGDTVDVHGIEVGLEPDGFRRLAKLHSPETTDAEVESFRPGNALSLVFLPPGQIPPEYRKIWKAAAFRPSGSRPAPQFAANDGGEGLRPIKRSEGTILGYCVHAVLNALQEGLLVAPDVASGDEVALQLSVPGDDADAFEDEALPEVEANIVGWPEADGLPPAEYEVTAATLAAADALPAGQRILAIVGFESTGAPEQNIPAGAFALALFAPDEGEFLASVALDSKDLSVIEGGVLALLQSAAERPVALLTDHSQVALVTFPMGRALGMAPRFGSFHSSFAALVDDTIRDLGGAPAPRLDSTLDALEALGGESVPTHFPKSLETHEDWEDALTFTSGALLFAAQDAELLDDATHRYWGSRKAGVRASELMGTFGAATAFLHYAFEDHRKTPESPTAVELLINTAKELPEVSAQEQACYEARRDAIVSIFQVNSHGSEVTDLITNETFPVGIDPNDLRRFADHLIPLRHYRLGGLHGFAIAGFPVEAAAKQELMGQLQTALGGKPSHGLLRTKGHALGGLWLLWMKRVHESLESAPNA